MPRQDDAASQVTDVLPRPALGLADLGPCTCPSARNVRGAASMAVPELSIGSRSRKGNAARFDTRRPPG